MTKIINSNRGFSLVELLVSISLLTILAICFLPLLTTSYSGIQVAGDRNKAINIAQEKIERSFNQGAKDDARSEITINFPGGDTFKIEGENIKVNEEYGEDSSIEFDVFIPKK